MVGHGLKIDDSGKVSLDFQGRFTWGGPHIFVRPVVFSPDQRFAVSSLYASEAETGSLLHFNGQSWNALAAPRGPSALVSFGGRPVWSAIDLTSHVAGVLPVASGGTGLGRLDAEGIVTAHEGAYSILPPGMPGMVLTAGEKGLEWEKPSGLQGSGQAGTLSIWTPQGALASSGLTLREGFLSWSDSVTGVRLSNDMPAGLSMRGNQLKVGLNFSSLGQRKYGQEGVALQFDVAANRPVLSCVYVSDRGAAKTLLAWDRGGALITGIVPVERLRGVLPPAAGGTGQNRWQRGDLLYADADGSLARLSARGREGCILGVQNGLPVWLPASADAAASANLSASATPALRLENGTLWFEQDGARMAVALKEEIPASLRLGTRIGLQEGGTGTDLSVLPPHTLLVSQGTESIGGVETGPEGTCLVSRGPQKGFVWETRFKGVSAKRGKGVLVDLEDSVADFRIDTSSDFAPHWKGDHVFGGSTGFLQDLVLGKGLSFPRGDVRHVSETGDLWREGEHLYFRQSGQAVCLTQPSAAPTTPRESVYLSVCQGATVPEGVPFRVKTPVPYGAEHPLERVRWRLKRVDVRCEQPPTTEEARVELLVNGDPLFTEPLTILPFTDHQFTIHFQQDLVFSGDLLQFCARVLGGGDCWSAWLLLESA